MQENPHLVGIAAAGSLLTKQLDEYSDLDLVLVTKPEHFSEAVASRAKFCESLGNYLVGFSGEHVGEPSLWITLYEDPLLHVDFKFVRLDQFASRNDQPEILWEKEGALIKAAMEIVTKREHPNLQWIEDRFWVWVHFGATKIGRGEIFEAIDMLSFLRSRVLGPLTLAQQGAAPHGLKRIEFFPKADLGALRSTVPIYDAKSCEISLKESAKLYVELRELLSPLDLVRQRRAEMTAMKYLHEVSEKI